MRIPTIPSIRIYSRRWQDRTPSLAETINAKHRLSGIRNNRIARTSIKTPSRLPNIEPVRLTIEW